MESIKSLQFEAKVPDLVDFDERAKYGRKTLFENAVRFGALPNI